MKRNFFSPALILSLGTLGSYLLGFIREPLFAHAYGKSSLTDAYYNAFQISDILFLVFISSALLGLVTPLFVQEREKNISNGYTLFGNFFVVLNTTFLAVIVVAWFFLPELLENFFPTSYAHHSEEIIQMGKIFLISNFIFGISNFIGTFSMVHKRFVSTSLAPLLYNIGIISGIYFFAESYGIYAAVYGVLGGAILHFTSRCVEYFWYSEKFFFHVDLTHPALKELVISMVFRWGTVAAVPLILLLFSTLSNPEPGLYTLFRYTHNFQSAPIAIFGLAFATASFPVLSRLFAEKKISQLHTSFWKSVQKILFWTLPSGIVLYGVGENILSVLYNLPKTDFMFLLPVLALIIPLEALSHIFSRAFNSIKKTYIPLWANICLFAGASISAFILVFMDVSLPKVLSYSYGIGFVSQLLLYVVMLRKEKFFIGIKMNSLSKIFPLLMTTISTVGVFYFLKIFSSAVENFFSNPILLILASLSLYGFIFFSVLGLLWKRKFLRKLREMI